MEFETTITELFKLDDSYEVWDEEKQSWVEIKSSSYFEIVGFPDSDIADMEITSISVRKGELKLLFSTVDYTAPEGVIYIKCKNEEDLLNKFIDAWEKLDPDIISGWNIEFFDIPYIVNRIKRVLGDSSAKRLSPWRLIHEYSQKSMYDTEENSYRLLGITTVDLLQAYKKFSFKNQESYKLDYIAKVVLKEQKIDYSEYGSLHDLWVKNPSLYLDYNIHDSDLVFRINEKTGLINQIVTLAYDAKVNYADAFTSVLLWEVIADNKLFTKNIVSKSFAPRNRKLEKIEGAFVKHPIVGKHKYVIGIDLDSLYPHLIMQYNISPETFFKCIRMLRSTLSIDDIVDGKLLLNETIMSIMKDNDVGYTPNGAFFKNDKRGFLPELMDEYYNDRKRYKDLLTEVRKKLETEKNPVELEKLQSLRIKYNNMQMAKKIALNSAYGALSNEWFAYYDIDLAEAITYAGQLAIKWISTRINLFINETLGNKKVKDYIIANDTDSAYINMEDLVNALKPQDVDPIDFIEKYSAEVIDVFIDKTYEELKELTNAYENKMSMKVESISKYGIWTAKKKYALLMVVDEGVRLETPEVKIKGLSAIQSSTPMICRDSIKEALRIILDGNKSQLYEHVDNFSKIFNSSRFDEIASTSQANGIDKYEIGDGLYGLRTPLHVRGAIIFNGMLKKYELQKKYQKIKSGEKVKYCYLKMPNPTKEDVISSNGELPKEFVLEAYLDYEKQLNKTFLKPINDISQHIGWSLYNRVNLDALFGD